MAQIEIRDLTFYYNDFYHPVFEHLNVNLDTEWKLALVGRNGRGKSTLLKLLSGSLEATSGEVRRDAEVSYFPYMYDASYTKAMDVVKECIGGLRTLELHLQQYEDNFTRGDFETEKRKEANRQNVSEEIVVDGMEVEGRSELSVAMEVYYDMLNRYIELDGYAMESHIRKELSQMGLSEELLEQDFCTLSGGEQTCMLIIALFLRKDAFVLLDEPTNHLDVEKKEHLKEYLKKKKGYMIASHDTVFLDEVCDHIFAINKADISVEQGNYSTWHRNMELKEQFELRTRQKLEQEIGQLERQSRQTRDWSNIGNKQKYDYAGHARTNGTRAYMRQAKAAEQHIQDNLARKKQLLRNMEEERKLNITQEIVEKDCLLAADKVTFCYDDVMEPVLQNVTLHIYPGDKIWLRGKNGAGKTTLLKLLAGKLHGAGVRKKGGISIAYVTQEPVCRRGSVKQYLQEAIDKSKDGWGWNKPETGLQQRTKEGGKRHSDFEERYRTFYAKFKELCMLFALPPDFERRPLETLSSGELKKVDIARTLAENHQILFLDEPLNYMDVQFKAQLEMALSKEELTLVFVEHNEEFGRKVANQVVEL